MNKNSSNQGGMNWGGRRGRVPSNIGERRHPTIIPQGEFFFILFCATRRLVTASYYTKLDDWTCN
jgi:hypothetical protein